MSLTDRWLLTILACPVCRGHPLALDATSSDGDIIHAGRLSCADCGRSYVIEDGIAGLLPDELDPTLAPRDGAWDKWGGLMNHFLTWRDRTWGTPEAAQERRRSSQPLHQAFVEFCGLHSAAEDVLDIGCGTGHVRDLLSPDCRYVGVDPLPGGRDPQLKSLPAHIPRPAQQFRKVQAVGEALPFCAETFDTVLVMGSLDHCNDPAQLVAEARRVLRPSGMLAILQGLSESAGVGRLGRRIVRSAASVASRGVGAPCAAATHLHSFTTATSLELVKDGFEQYRSKVSNGRVFIRAQKPTESEGRA